jgi:hypothetical protein
MTYHTSHYFLSQQLTTTSQQSLNNLSTDMSESKSPNTTSNFNDEEVSPFERNGADFNAEDEEMELRMSGNISPAYSPTSSARQPMPALALPAARSSSNTSSAASNAEHSWIVNHSGPIRRPVTYIGTGASDNEQGSEQRLLLAAMQDQNGEEDDTLTFSPTCIVCYELTDCMTDCNHHLCQNCFDQLDSQLCPMCRTFIWRVNAVPFISRLIADTTIDAKCGTKVKRGDVGKHIENCTNCALNAFKDIKKKCDGMQGDLTRKQRRIDDVLGRLEASQTETASLEAQLERANDEISFQRQQRNIEQQKMAEMQSTHEKEMKEYIDLLDQMDKAQGEIIDLNNKVSHLQKQNASLKRLKRRSKRKRSTAFVVGDDDSNRQKRMTTARCLKGEAIPSTAATSTATSTNSIQTIVIE